MWRGIFGYLEQVCVCMEGTGLPGAPPLPDISITWYFYLLHSIHPWQSQRILIKFLIKLLCKMWIKLTELNIFLQPCRLSYKHFALYMCSYLNYSIFRYSTGTCGRQDRFHFYLTKNNSKFDRDLTPLMLAAQCNEAEIIRLLLDRGEYIEEPHAIFCSCKDCTEAKGNNIQCM